MSIIRITFILLTLEELQTVVIVAPKIGKITELVIIQRGDMPFEHYTDFISSQKSLKIMVSTLSFSLMSIHCFRRSPRRTSKKGIWIGEHMACADLLSAALVLCSFSVCSLQGYKNIAKPVQKVSMFTDFFQKAEKDFIERSGTEHKRQDVLLNWFRGFSHGSGCSFPLFPLHLF